MSFTDRYSEKRAEKDFEFKKLMNDPKENRSFHLREDLISIRLGLGLTQTEFAELVGEKQPLISRLENGTQNITINKLNRILYRTNTGARVKIEIDEGESELVHH